MLGLIGLADQKSVDCLIEDQRRKAEGLRHKSDKYFRLAAIIERLKVSWSEPGLGAYCYQRIIYGGHLEGGFFLMDSEGRLAVVREFLPKDVIAITDGKEWRAYEAEWKNSKRRKDPFDRIPPAVHLVSLSEIQTRPCPKCGATAPLIRHLLGTIDQDEPRDEDHLELACFICAEAGRINLK